MCITTRITMLQIQPTFTPTQILDHHTTGGFLIPFSEELSGCARLRLTALKFHRTQGVKATPCDDCCQLKKRGGTK